MKRTNYSAAVGVVASVVIGVAFFFGTLKIADVQAQRQGYVEKRVVSTGTATGLSAFADQLAPNPETGMCLQYDVNNRAVWGPCGGLPSGGTPGQVVGVVALTATRTVVVTGTQTSIGTQTYSYTETVIGTTTGTQTATGGTQTATVTATGTSTAIGTGGSADTLAVPYGLVVTPGLNAYVADYNGGKLEAFDVSDPNDPALISSVSISGLPRDVVLSSNYSYAYVPTYTGNTLQVIYTDDMSAKGSVALTSGCGPYKAARYGNYVFIACSLIDKIDIVNVTDPNSPTLMTPISTEDEPRGIDISSSGQYLYVAARGASKFSIYDVSNPSSPSHVRTISTETGPYAVLASGSIVYVAAFEADKLQAIDVSTPASASVVGTVSTRDQPVRIGVYGSYVFATMYNDAKLSVHSFADPANPSAEIGYVTTETNPYAIVIVGTKAYITSSSANKLQVFDIGNYVTRTVTVTATATQTATYTLTNTQTGSATGTQTADGTSTFTSSTTGVGTSTGTEWKTVTPYGRNTLGDYYLANITSEGDQESVFKLDELSFARSNGPFTPRAMSASCSSGSDGLIASFNRTGHIHFDPVDPYPLWLDGLWRAHLWASSTGPASMRIEVWDNDGEGGEVKWFDFLTPSFDTPGASLIEAETIQGARYPATSSHYVTVKVYAVCSSAQTVSLLLLAPPDSRLESPMESAKTDLATILSRLSEVEYVVTTKEPTLPTGQSGAVLVYTGAGTSVQTSKTTSVPSLSVGGSIQMTKVQSTGTNTATATATTVNPVTDSPTLTIAPEPVTFACLSTSSSVTISGALTLGYGTVVVSIGPFTPKASTNALRVSVHLTGQATAAGAAVVTAKVEALTGSPSHGVYTAGNLSIVSLAASGWGSLSSESIGWDSYWTNPTTFRLVAGASGTFIIPTSSSGEPFACMTIEELTL